jgi:acid phosphatase type 7
VVGTGGRSRYGFASTPKANSVIRSSSTFGALRMTLSPDSFSWDFVPEPGSNFADAGSAPCH